MSVFALRRHRAAPWALMLALALVGTGVLLAWPAAAQQLNLDLGAGEDGGTLTGRVVQLVLLITVLSLAPSLLVVVTSFTRIIVVLSLLRTAIGAAQTPPNTILIGLALFLTAFIMTPTFQRAYDEGVAPLMAGELEETEAIARAAQPFRDFMLRQVREEDLALFLNLSQTPVPEQPQATPYQVLVPAFMISELRRAFEIGFLLFVPFLVIDLVVASILMGMGMMMLPPISISLPFKLIFFVLVDGWGLVAGSLVRSFGS
ncbi:flagellar type III secretion system pore protein FliP [Zavarzinia sp. CC-PAN008]|uniref:flagellar type III secretion system pore protein FliP n=1 Tax=Zavarzinia sp. CC-PAN008 TaxID=3243332 RepID=UPI003F749A44